MRKNEIYAKLLDCEKRIFNRTYEITLKDIPVELYVEMDSLNAQSGGVYSILNDGWIKKPKREEVPEIDYEKFNKEFEDLEDDYFDLMDDLEAQGIGALEFPLDESLNLKEGLNKEDKLLYKSNNYSEQPKEDCIRVYHQTNKENINSILDNGLLPSKAKPYDNPGQVVWVSTKEPTDFSMWNFGNCLFELDIPNSFDGLRKVNSSEYVCDKEIPSEYINAIYLQSPYRREIMNDFQNTGDINKSIERFKNGELKESKLQEVYPNKGEKKKDFISRFMSVTKNEYHDEKQRYAVALSYWDRRNKKKENLEEDLELSNEYDSEGNQLTKEQAEFFKNSKVRDNQGRLLVCYHGTGEEFDSFSSDFFSGGGLFGDGFYFTPRQELAKDYGKNIKKCYLNINNPFNYYGWNDDDLFKLLDAYGDYDKEKLEKIDYHFNYDLDLLDNILEPVLGFEPYDSFKEKLEECGYDGLIADEEIVAYNSNQIKSVDNKQPTKSDNINEAKAITWGDLDYGKKTDTRRMMGGRGTGHFGTGFYFVGAEGPYGLEGNRYFDYAPNRPIYEIDLDAYNLFKPKDNGTAYKIHDNMKVINDCYREGRLDSTPKGETKDLLGLLRIIDEEAYEQSYERDDLSDEEAEKEFQRLYKEYAYNFIQENDLDPYIYYETKHFIDGNKAGKIEQELQQAIERKQSTLEDLNRAINNLSKLLNVDKNKLVDIIKNAKDKEDTISTQIFKALGYEGVDNTHLNKDADGFSGLDNFSYGTVIYDLKPGTYKKIKEPRGDSSYGFNEG